MGRGNVVVIVVGAFAVGTSLACGGLLGMETLSSLPPDFPATAAGEVVWITQVCVDRDGTRGRKIDVSYQFESTPKQNKALAAWGAELRAAGWREVSIETLQRGDEFVDFSLTGSVAGLAWWRPGC